MLAEATTVEISKQKAPETFSGNIDVARAGGKAAGDARKAIESQTGVPVITSKNAAQLNQVVTDLLEGATTSPEKQALIHWQQNLWAITKRKHHPSGWCFLFGAALLLRKSGRLRAGD